MGQFNNSLFNLRNDIEAFVDVLYKTIHLPTVRSSSSGRTGSVHPSGLSVAVN